MAKKILVIDDDANTCQLVRRILEKDGFQAETCTDPLKSIQLAQSFKPDLVLLDILMPRMDGTELARRLSELPGFQSPMIFLSVLAGDNSTTGGKIPCVPKPFAPEELLQKVRETIGSP